MTREEKIAILKDIIDGEIIHPQVRRDVGIWAIKVLEQEPVLNKIRAEIEQIADEEQKHDEKWAKGLRYAVKIIDKYNVERRDKE